MVKEDKFNKRRLLKPKIALGGTVKDQDMAADEEAIGRLIHSPL